MPSLHAVPRAQVIRSVSRLLEKPRAYFLIALVFYLFTLQPSLSWGDGVRLQREAITGESFILAELVDRPFAPDPFPFAKLGIAAWDHPLYVILGYSLVRLGTLIFPASNPLWWVNLISAVFGAGAIALVFRIGLRLTNSFFGSATAALLLAVSHTFWWHAATPEVYTLHAFLLLAALLFFIEYFEDRHSGALLGSTFCVGLALSNHFMAGLAIFPLLVFVGLHFQALRKKGAFTPRTVALVFGVFFLALSPILLQAVRLLRTFTFVELFGTVVGANFFENPPSISIPESFVRYLVLLVIQFSPVGLVLGLVGLRIAWTAQARSARLVPLLYGIYLLFGVLYRVADQFAFHLTSYVMFALAVPFGWVALKKRLAPRYLWIGKTICLLPVLFAPFFYTFLAANLPEIGLDEEAFGVPAIGTGVRDGLNFYINPNKRGDDQPYTFGRDTLSALPENALVLAQWYTDTDEYFIFRYFQAVEGLRADVEIEGWTQEDAFTFDPSLAIELVFQEAGRRPVYLASLSDEYYGAVTILKSFCVFPENDLFRVVPLMKAPPEASCLASD